MTEHGRTLARAAALAIAACLALGAGCTSQAADAARDAGAPADSETDWSGPYDGAVWGDAPTDGEPEAPCECDDPTCGIEHTCAPGVKECLCDTVCDDWIFADQGWAPYLDDYRCYSRCGDDGSCPRAGDVCTELGTGPTAAPMCLPRIEVESDAFAIKVAVEEQAYSIVDAAQVDVRVTVGGETRHLVMAFGVENEGGMGSPAAIELLFMENAFDDYYYLVVDIYEEAWAPGTAVLSEGGEAADGGVEEPRYDFSAALYRIGERIWIAGQTTGGTIELVETQDPALCDGPGCPKSIVGPLSIDFVGLAARFSED